MAIALTSNRNNTSYGVNSYVADDETDIKDLPIFLESQTCKKMSQNEEIKT